MLENQTFLITGIADENSLAMKTAEKILENNGKVVCTGLGVTPFHNNLSEKAAGFLNKNYEDFEAACKKVLGDDVYTAPLDVTLPESLKFLAEDLKSKDIQLNGFLHAIAMDKTIRNKSVKPMLEVTAEEFNDTMNVSAFSLISFVSRIVVQWRFAERFVDCFVELYRSGESFVFSLHQYEYCKSGARKTDD